MKKIFLNPSQLLAMIDYPPLHSPEAFASYREKFKSGDFVEPIIVVPIKIVIEFLQKNLTRYIIYQKELEQFLVEHPMVEYFMLGGKHRSAAATILGLLIPCLVVKNDQDINDVHLLMTEGKITGRSSVGHDFTKTLQILDNHFFEHQRFWTMDEKTQAMVENGDIKI